MRPEGYAAKLETPPRVKHVGLIKSDDSLGLTLHAHTQSSAEELV